MKVTFATATLALGLVSAAPTAAPAKFALQITAKVDGTPQSLYLGKDLSSNGVSDIKEAASCSINAESQLLCEQKTIGVVKTNENFDMGAIKPASGEKAWLKGFSVDENMTVHWKSDDFKNLKMWSVISKPTSEKDGQNGEALFGLWKGPLTGGKTQLYFQLGCPGGDHNTRHSKLETGTAKAIPL